MATTQELFIYVQQCLDITLEEDDLWSLIAQEMTLGSYLSPNFVHCLIDAYPKAVRKDPDFSLVARELMKRVFSHLLLQYKTNNSDHYVDAEIIKKMFNAWTLWGSQDISLACAEDLYDSLHSLYSKNLETRDCFFEIVATSNTLWSKIGSVILDNVKRSPQYIHVFESSKIVFHRHIPKRTDLYDTENVASMYARMCGANTNVKPTLLEMRNILKGPHHNALAWHAALAVCGLEDPMQMLDTFSALTLDPTKPAAWKFWHLLCECTKDNASGQELMVSLTPTQMEMHQEFERIWSIVDALEEDDARYEQAAQMCSSNTKDTLCIPIPECSTFIAYFL